jgi:hypothetical protein
MIVEQWAAAELPALWVGELVLLCCRRAMVCHGQAKICTALTVQFHERQLYQL